MNSDFGLICSDNNLMEILYFVKQFLLVIQIIVPILLLIYASIRFYYLMKNPDNKKELSKIRNMIIAAVVVFFIPVIINATMGFISDDYEFSRCWNDAVGVDTNVKYESIEEKERHKINENPNAYEKGVPKVVGTKLNSIDAKEIPDSVLKKNGSHSDLSVLVVNDAGNVVAEKNPDILREGGSTAKVFTGFGAVKLLDPAKDIIINTKYAQNMPYMGTPDVKVGQRLTVSQAATKDFPGSSNITTANIAIAIGKKYYNVTSDADAYNKGLDKINELIKDAGCSKTVLPSSSGVNYNYKTNKWTGNKNGISTGIYGITANDLGLITINAMKDENFSKGINYGKNGICSPPDRDSFFIKSGTQAYCHGVWGFNYNGKRYYVVILGVNCKNSGDNKCKIFNDIYQWSKSNLLK